MVRLSVRSSERWRFLSIRLTDVCSAEKTPWRELALESGIADLVTKLLPEELTPCPLPVEWPFAVPLDVFEDWHKRRHKREMSRIIEISLRIGTSVNPISYLPLLEIFFWCSIGRRSSTSNLLSHEEVENDYLLCRFICGVEWKRLTLYEINLLWETFTLCVVWWLFRFNSSVADPQVRPHPAGLCLVEAYFAVVVPFPHNIGSFPLDSEKPQKLLVCTLLVSNTSFLDRSGHQTKVPVVAVTLGGQFLLPRKFLLKPH